MREERGQLAGNVVINELYTLWGTIGGTVKIVDGGRFYMRGTIYGDVFIEDGGRAHIFGNITGNLTVAANAKVIIGGIVSGKLTNNGGRVYIEDYDSLGGKVGH